jgi:dTDP-4-dehydrorhamnose reductase
MNILVFGKDGQLGKAFKSVFDASKLGELHRITYVGRDECDLAKSDTVAKLLDQIKPNVIINTAAYTAVDKAETEVDLAYAINAKAPEVMALYAKHCGATFLHYSTDYVFDGSKKTAYIESDVRNPLAIYGKSKAAGEEAIEAAFEDSNSSAGRYAIFRTSWVYGEGDNFIRTILRIAKERETLKVIADQYGAPTSATWLAEVSLALALDEQHHLRPFQSGIYHAVPQGETTWHALAYYAVQVAIEAGAALKLRPEAIAAIPATEYPLPAPRPMNSRMASNRLQALWKGDADIKKRARLLEPWDGLVKAYVHQLVRSKLV